jgi:hypothetical protein
MIAISNDNMVNHINFKQLTASNEVACDFNVRFGWSGFTARMLVLCGAPVYVQCPIGGAGITPAFSEGGMLWMRMNHPRRARPNRRFVR